MTQRLPLYVTASLLAHMAVLLVWNAMPVPSPTQTEHNLQVSLIQAVQRTATRLATAVQAQDPTSTRHNNVSRHALMQARRTHSTPHTTGPATTPPVTALPAAAIAANLPATQAQTSNLSADAEARLQTALHIAFKSYFNYPAMAQRHGWEGVVKLSLRLEPDGHLSEVRLVQSSGHAALDAAALATAQRIPPLHEAVAWLQGNSHVILLPVEYRLIDG